MVQIQFSGLIEEHPQITCDSRSQTTGAGQSPQMNSKGHNTIMNQQMEGLTLLSPQTMNATRKEESNKKRQSHGT